MSTTVWSASITTFPTRIRFLGVTSLTTVLPWFLISEHHRELTTQGSRRFTKPAISTLLFRTVGVSDTTCSMNYDSTSTARPRRLQSSIRIRGFLFLWYLADRSERSTSQG